MKSIRLKAPTPSGEPIRFETIPGEALYAWFNKPGVRGFTNSNGVRIELDLDPQEEQAA